MPRNGESGAGGGGGGSGEGANGGLDKSFCSKPARGWLYPDNTILNEGVTFNVRYIGCLEIKTSMKTLNFSTRSQVAKECINRVCEAAGLKTSKKRRVDKRIQHSICDIPNMEHAGTNVMLRVSSKFLSLMNLETNEMIAKHDMPRISFASGGDSDTLDFVAYVAKNLEEWRACYVLECGGGHAQDLISIIGQAFELRYNEYFNKTQDFVNLNNDKDYYNDLPGKLPPELLDNETGKCGGDDKKIAKKFSQINIKKPRERLNSNLIDLNSPPADHDYVNDKNVNVQNGTEIPKNSNNTNKNNMQQRDVFDMQPFSLTAEVQRSQLMTESWFHGAISRPVAENLLRNDGDFLVRESQGKPGQYVLSGFQLTTSKHLLLIDPAGVVRTKDRVFDSISHLINYHWTNVLPIVSEESALVLRTPILRKTMLTEKL